MRMWISSAGALFVGAVGLLSAQATEPWVDIVDGQSRSSVAVVETAPYSGAPSASIPAKPAAPGVPVTAKAFAIRAWQESGKSRVVVYAVTVASRNGETVDEMTQIATHLLDQKQSAQITETAHYGARPVTVTSVTK